MFPGRPRFPSGEKIAMQTPVSETDISNEPDWAAQPAAKLNQPRGLTSHWGVGRANWGPGECPAGQTTEKVRPTNIQTNGRASEFVHI